MKRKVVSIKFYHIFLACLLVMSLPLRGQEVRADATYATHYKTAKTSWVDAVWKAIDALPEEGGTVYIQGNIEIDKSIDLRNTKKQICIEGGYTNIVNPGIGYNSMIVKTGDFDAIILHNYCSLKNIGVTSKYKKDKHDGIWITGYGCTLTNVGVTDQGGNGIRIGNKSYDGDYLTDCCVLQDVKCIRNRGWGIYISDEQVKEGNQADANANAFYSMDLRKNAAGGIYVNKCIDNHFYSPIIQLNGVKGKAPTGSAGIYFGAKTRGNYVYSPYCENKDWVQYEVYCEKGSSDNVIIGARADEKGYGYVDDGNNVFITHRSAVMHGVYIPHNIGVGELKISNPDLNGGYMQINQTNTSTLGIGSAINSGNVELMNGTLKTTGLLFGTYDGQSQVYYDRINDFICKIESHVAPTKVPANSSVSKGMTSAAGIKMNCAIVATPYNILPSGVSYYVTCTQNNTATMTFVNSTSHEVEIPKTKWRVVAIDFSILQSRPQVK